MRRWFLPNLSKPRQELVHMTVNSCPLRWDCSQWSKHKLTIHSFWQMVWEELGLQFGPERAETAGPSPPANALKRAGNPDCWAQRPGRDVVLRQPIAEVKEVGGFPPLWAEGQWTHHVLCWRLQFYLFIDSFQQSQLSVSATWVLKLHSNGCASLGLQKQIFRFSKNI